MNLRSFTARTVVAGATTALAAGALVGLGATAANAETASSTYTCTAPANAYVSDFAVTVDGGLPVTQYWAGAPVPADLLRVTVTSALTPEQAGALGSFGVTGAHSDDFGVKLGSKTVPIPVGGTFAASGGTTTWTATGSNDSFVTPNPGLKNIVLPAAFTMTTEKTNDQGAQTDFLPLACVIKEGTTPSKLAEITLLKQASTTVVKPKTITVKKTKAVKIPVEVHGDAEPVVIGKVVAKEGKKTLKSVNVKNGKATLALGKLKVGSHKITVSYVDSSGSIKGSSDKVTVKVTR
jgi:hypothetical protein